MNMVTLATDTLFAPPLPAKVPGGASFLYAALVEDQRSHVVRRVDTVSATVKNCVVVLLTEIRAPFQERPGHSGDTNLI
jgi:hypothetical protein